MAEILLEKVSKIYPGGVNAVNDLDLRVHDRELLVLVGPSGCGKSTTLRMIAGLEEVTSGVIRIGDRVVNDIPPRDRDIAMVFQNSALYPHKSVRENLAFGLHLRRAHGLWGSTFGRLFGGDNYSRALAERGQIERSVARVAEMLDIGDLLDRRPGTLSGGQQQRVAAGRAAVREPQVFLFDEPLSNLDARIRVELRIELKRLLTRLGATALYVTHDQEEALTLGDRMAVMHNGVVRQIGVPIDVYRRPADRFVAGFVGSPPMNFLEGRLLRENGRLVFDEGENRLTLGDTHQDRASAFVDQPLVMGFRPEALSPVKSGVTGATLNVALLAVEPLGDRVDLYTSTARHGRIVCRTGAVLAPTDDKRLWLNVDMDRAHFFEPGGLGRNLIMDGTP